MLRVCAKYVADDANCRVRTYKPRAWHSSMWPFKSLCTRVVIRVSGQLYGRVCIRGGLQVARALLHQTVAFISSINGYHGTAALHVASRRGYIDRLSLSFSLNITPCVLFLIINHFDIFFFSSIHA